MAPIFRSCLALLIAAASSTFSVSAEAETLTLAQAIEMGVKRSPVVRAAKAGTAQAAGQLSSTTAGYFPKLSASLVGGSGSFTPIASGSDSEVRAPGQPTQRGSQVLYTLGWRAQAELAWTLWDFGKTSNRVGERDNALKSSGAREKESVAETSLQVANAYLTLFHQEKLLEVAKTTLEGRERLFAIAKALVKVGTYPPLEELRSQARFEAAQREYARARAEHDQARIGFGILLGADDPTALRLTTPRLPRLTADTASAMRDSEKRQALVAAERSLDSRKSAADATFALYLPSLSAAGTVAYSSASSDPSFGPVQADRTDTTRSATGSITLGGNLWDPALSGAIDAARAQVVEAEALLDDARRNARSVAAQAAIQVKLGQLQLEAARRAEDAAAGVRKVMEKKYETGTANPLELIEAEDSDLSARVARIQTELDYQQAIARLCWATGRSIVDDDGKSGKDRD